MKKAVAIIATSWNNGQHHSTGAGYGIKIRARDRDKFFNKQWKSVRLYLADKKECVLVNINKKSFWDNRCRELVSKNIGIWLRKQLRAPWKEGKPPKVILRQITGARFYVSLMK